MEGLALWIASETMASCEECNGVSYGLISRQADPSNENALLRSIENKLGVIAGDNVRGVWFAASWGNDEPQSATITLMGSAAEDLADSVANHLTKLAGQSRLRGSLSASRSSVLENWNREVDEDMLHSVLKLAVEAGGAHKTQPLVPRAIPPPGSLSIDQILARARSRFRRLTPSEAHQALVAPTSTDGSPLGASRPAQAVLIDIRPEAQRRAEGQIPGALIVERNVLE